MKAPAVYYLFKVNIWKSGAIKDDLEITFHILGIRQAEEIEALKVSPNFLHGPAIIVDTTRTQNLSGGVQQTASFSASFGDQTQWREEHRWKMECIARGGAVDVHLKRTGERAPAIPTQFDLQFVTPYEQDNPLRMACDVDWKPSTKVGLPDDGWTGPWHQVDLPPESDTKTDWGTWTRENWEKGSKDNIGFDHRSVVPFPIVFMCEFAVD